MLPGDVGMDGTFGTHVLLADIKFDYLLFFLSSDSDISCQLPGEPELVPDRLHVMDGNNSMKRVDGSGHSDEHVFLSDHFIPPETVDNFKDDVATHPGTQAQPAQALPHGNDNSWCTKHWTATNAVSEGTVEVFQQTSGFLSTCCHAIVETLVEMWQSGEL
jgi:Kyakuja-Dileera-Zisupton transposase